MCIAPYSSPGVLSRILQITNAVVCYSFTRAALKLYRAQRNQDESKEVEKKVVAMPDSRYVQVMRVVDRDFTAERADATVATVCFRDPVQRV